MPRVDVFRCAGRLRSGCGSGSRRVLRARGPRRSPRRRRAGSRRSSSLSRRRQPGLAAIRVSSPRGRLLCCGRRRWLANVAAAGGRRRRRRRHRLRCRRPRRRDAVLHDAPLVLGRIDVRGIGPIVAQCAEGPHTPLARPLPHLRPTIFCCCRPAICGQGCGFLGLRPMLRLNVRLRRLHRRRSRRRRPTSGRWRRGPHACGWICCRNCHRWRTWRWRQCIWQCEGRLVSWQILPDIAL